MIFIYRKESAVSKIQIYSLYVFPEGNEFLLNIFATQSESTPPYINMSIYKFILQFH